MDSHQQSAALLTELPSVLLYHHSPVIEQPPGKTLSGHLRLAQPMQLEALGMPW